MSSFRRPLSSIKLTDFLGSVAVVQQVGQAYAFEGQQVGQQGKQVGQPVGQAYAFEGQQMEEVGQQLEQVQPGSCASSADASSAGSMHGGASSRQQCSGVGARVMGSSKQCIVGRPTDWLVLVLLAGLLGGVAWLSR